MITFEPAKTALLVMDLQVEIVTMYRELAAPVIERTAGLVAAARAAKVPVIYVAVGFRPGYPELSQRSPYYATVAPTKRLQNTSIDSIVPELRPQADEPLVVKRRVNAFCGTDLEILLRHRGIDTLILTGIATSGVVLSTVRHGFDNDYRQVVVKDCCADIDPEVHRVLTEKVFLRQATVGTASEVTAALQTV
jgi:nicotinamidase-related amidase